jgi:hypothetical protein
MSGYAMMMLVQGTTRDEAIKAADGEIGVLFENHDLVEGDKGYVDALGWQDDSDAEVLSAKEDPAKFVARLRELEQHRIEAVQEWTEGARRYANEAGVFGTKELVPEEAASGERGRKLGMVGYCLRNAGDILAQHWTSCGILYDPENYHCGVDEDRIKEIEAKPDEWWLVATTVG